MKNAANSLALMVCVTAAGLVAKKALELAWESTTDKPAPKNPAAPGVSWEQALLWGGAAGVVAGLVNTVVRRGIVGITDASVEDDVV